MAVLVTGGAGFIGSALVRRLMGAWDGTVVNADALTYAGNLESLGDVVDDSRYHFEQVDICDARALRRIFNQYQPAGVVHLAAESHVDRSIDGPATFIRTNIVGTYTLLEEARAYWSRLTGGARAGFRFLYVSTDEVFGSLDGGDACGEETPYRPNSPYSASKAAAEHLVRAWHRTYGLPTLTTICCNNYGPYQFPEKLIPLTILSALDGRPVPVYGTGHNVRDWLYVEDHVEALLRVLAEGRIGETYAIGGHCEKRNIDVVRAICGLLDQIRADPVIGPRESLIRFVQDRPGHDGRYALDASKIRRELGWAPRETFDTGLRRTVEWYLANQSWCERVRSGAFHGERLGLGVVA